MIELYVNDQTLRLYTPVIAADTLRYLTGVVHFTGEEWEGYSKWVHFVRGEGPGAVAYDVALSDDAWDESVGLSLTAGEWTVFVTGSCDEARLTTVPLILTVKESGLIDAPLHPMPLSVAEQIDAKAATALAYAAAVKAAADAGDYDGKDGRSFVIGGYYDTMQALNTAVPQPEAGAAYGVGTSAPYDICVWDAVNGRWVNNGPIQGVPGERGRPGVVFTPAVDTGGNLSWTNDGGLANPQTRNIRGPAGLDGGTGPAGKSAFESAQEGGYTGTEATFSTALAAMPYHNARHLPEGADPITVRTGNLENLAVTGAKIADRTIRRVKLAGDALYSPVREITGTEAAYSVTADDIGYTLHLGEGITGVALTREVSDQMPVGAEIGLVRAGLDAGTALELTLPAGTGRTLGAGRAFTTAVLYEGYVLYALKKISDTVWLVLGHDVEVIT